MSVELTPKGTRGRQMPQIARPIMGAIFGLLILTYRLLGSRMKMAGRPLLLLTTTGAKTGQPRQTLLCWFPDSDNSWQIVASFAGSAKHPAWFVNLAKNPDKVWIELDGRTIKVQPESLKDAERAGAWQRIVALSPGYAKYQENTDREIPVVRLRGVG
jgi:deazaflavin-dependent oxidoreductase (nitroreductase family)